MLRSPSFPYAVRHAQTSAGQVAFFDHGSGPAVLLVHGLGGDCTHFEHVAPLLHDHCRLIGIDLPGCGLSPRPRGRLLHEQSRAVHGLLDHLGVERASLVGHSAGGLVCTRAALEDPARVERLVLMSSAGFRGYPLLMRWLARAMLRPPVLRALLPFSAVPLLDLVFHGRNEYTRKFVRDSVDQPDDRLPKMADTFHRLLPDLMVAGVVRSAGLVRAPVMVLWGERDRLVPPRGVRRVLAGQPEWRLEMLADCGHMPHVERPDETAAALSSFLLAKSVA
jgi:pimeloyl-ACP methyl ester carboxylesterase